LERTFFVTSVWLQAGQYLALAAQILQQSKKAAVVPYWQLTSAIT
jgi:hypothetical protein